MKPKTLKIFKDVGCEIAALDGEPIQRGALDRLLVERERLLVACILTTTSGPLNNGMTDENTMTIIRNAIAFAEADESAT